MTSYLAAIVISLLILLFSTAESWYAIARDCFTMLLAYIALTGLAVAGLWWIGGI